MQISERFNYKCTGIYKIENIITHEVYIGQAKNICLRIGQHLTSSISEKKSDYNYPLHKAFRKYGVDNFDLEILEQCDYDKLNEAEIYWVNKYDSYYSGYNQTKGGYQSIRLIKLTETQADEIKDLLINTDLTYNIISSRYNICKDTVHKINVGKMWYDSKYIYPLRVWQSPETLYKFDGTCIVQYDKITFKVVNKYPTRNIAAFALGDEKYGPHIGAAANGKRLSAYGFTWAIEDISKEDWLELLKPYLKEDNTLIFK